MTEIITLTLIFSTIVKYFLKKLFDAVIEDLKHVHTSVNLFIKIPCVVSNR